MTARWLATAASKMVVSDLGEYCKALQVQADMAYHKSDVDSKCVIIPWTPPAKNLLSKETFSTQQLAKEGMPVKGIYAWSAIRYAGHPMLRAHAFRRRASAANHRTIDVRRGVFGHGLAHGLQDANAGQGRSEPLDPPPGVEPQQASA